MKSSFTNQFIPSSANSCHYAVFLSFALDGLADLDSAEEDDEDENIAIQTESKSTRTKRFMLDIQAQKGLSAEKPAPSPASDPAGLAVHLE